ncbi:hypothetical protein BC351_29825 [Paenibacillus ferrarius]|uniref:Rpn family recombination-promoting nuclease/putative transposase n=1 Tax=Paenibacillus ferrarius TaxID=1469647 RepID=A0A1V4HGQ6_9BACL|nr:hypothetical protein BC351_29825 [Paenibacillus ferrarius]
MQLFNKYDIEKRSLYLWSKLYEAQLSEGQKYKELNKCITINILNYSFLPDTPYHSIFQLREIVTQLPLIDDIELHFIELPKLKENAVSLEEGLVKWLLFLKGTEKEKWKVLAMNEPQLRKAMDTLEFLSQNEEARRLYEMRQKALHDEASMLYGAREEGKAEGKAEGRAEGKFEVARNMLGEGIQVSLISRMTGLSEQEIERLKGQRH